MLRAAIRNDPVLHLALASDDAEVTVLGHTRWASVGVISEANAHPLNSERLLADQLSDTSDPYVIAAVNGDVDNYRDLRDADALALAPEITTDSKILPVLVPAGSPKATRWTTRSAAPWRAATVPPRSP